MEKIDVNIDWKVLGIAREDRTIVYYTIGAKKYVGMELELNLSLDERAVCSLLNTIVLACKYENYKITDGKIEDEELFKGDIRLFYIIMDPAEPPLGNTSKVMRVVVCDNDLVLPIEEGCHEDFKNQI